ncbi:MAG: phosphoribosylanthranilate isomerase [Paracoccus sp. (in: a-proteobacteria)]|uniref:phosphoribosylanthranilate isomerase n=1 Tax=Paracoccus sp. TaxID=267 RepID=UPI0026DEBA3C|nr:phosphoribosylanthranilate isomerase [Paracoccus sp. (in: a-proteobacteria)]MDO5621275.1 phosphoribosylanthranilate isomerase [Paracoccus sp. (in: a-proteobacteria)]
MTAVKICGLTSLDAVSVAAEAGARFVGFVFFPKSPRHVSVEQAAALAVEVPFGVMKVGLFVNPTDAALDEVLAQVPLDMIQLHGTETPARVQEVRARTGLPVMKAVGISGPQDLDTLWDYGLVADMLLVDAKPPKDADLPGGNGLAFDWRLLVGRRWLKPWMLAGGLTPENVAEAVRLTGAQAVDVSSGVESAPGQKNAALIRDFVAAAG